MIGEDEHTVGDVQRKMNQTAHEIIVSGGFTERTILIVVSETESSFLHLAKVDHHTVVG